jgi:outer membrane protein
MKCVSIIRCFGTVAKILLYFFGEQSMKRIVSLLVASVLCFTAGGVAAEGSKVGVVDVQKIMQTAAQMKTIQQKLEADFKVRRDKLVAMEEGLKKDMEKFKRESTVMNPTQKKDFEKKLITTQQAFERDGHAYQQDLTTAQNELMEGFFNKVRAAIGDIAKKEQYDVILQKDAVPFNVDKLDITAKVLETLH